MLREGVDVQFKSSRSQSSNCICNACFGADFVVKLSLPETKYHNGWDLETRHTDYWLCKKCSEKLAKAIEWPEGTA